MANIFSIVDVRGGINNSDSSVLLPDNQVVDARNVDFRSGTLGAKRRGTRGIDVTGSAFDSPVIAIFRHTPTNQLSQEELWGIDENGNVDRRVGGSWQNGVARSNDFVTVFAANYSANAVSLHGKLFIAARGDQDRLLLWDGTVLRWAGLQQPPPPTAANSGSGTFSGTRYYRIRFTAQAASGVTLRRSEPSTEISIAPSGSGSGVTVTKPAGTEVSTSVYAEGQTHWEVEASLDNILFYRIATVAIGTATYADTTAYTTGYAAFPLSEPIGEYIPPTSAQFVAVDEDRLVVAGNHLSEALKSTVSWSPVDAADGVGNDERIPTTTSNFITFDGMDGGGVKALIAGGGTGGVSVYKFSRVYKMVRTGIVTAAYSPIVVSYTRGCDTLGACAGTDAAGLPCEYFVDPSVGLCRLARNGVEDLGRPIRNTWYGHNPAPAIPSRIIYYPALEQVWFTLPVGSAQAVQTSDPEDIQTDDLELITAAITVPELLAMYEVRTGGIIFYDGIPASALALSLMFRDNGLAPVIGTELKDIGGGNTSYIHEADIGTEDSDGPFRAYVKTKPYILGDLWSKFGLMAGVLIAKASSGSTLFLNMIRNFGVEERDIDISLSPIGTEDVITKPIDNATMSELNILQLEYGDEEASDQEWDIDRLVFKIRPEEGSAG